MAWITISSVSLWVFFIFKFWIYRKWFCDELILIEGIFYGKTQLYVTMRPHVYWLIYFTTVFLCLLHVLSLHLCFDLFILQFAHPIICTLKHFMHFFTVNLIIYYSLLYFYLFISIWFGANYTSTINNYNWCILFIEFAELLII